MQTGLYFAALFDSVVHEMRQHSVIIPIFQKCTDSQLIKQARPMSRDRTISGRSHESLQSV